MQLNKAPTPANPDFIPQFLKEGSAEELQQLDFVLRGRYRKHRLHHTTPTPVYPSFHQIEVWRKQMGLPSGMVRRGGEAKQAFAAEKERVASAEDECKRHPLINEDEIEIFRLLAEKFLQYAPVKKGDTEETKRHDAEQVSGDCADYRLLQAIKLRRARERRETLGSSDSNAVKEDAAASCVSLIGGVSINPDVGRTQIPKDLIRTFVTFFPKTHPYHLVDHCITCGQSMLHETLCKASGELHEPPMLLPNSRFTMRVDGERETIASALSREEILERNKKDVAERRGSQDRDVIYVRGMMSSVASEEKKALDEIEIPNEEGNFIERDCLEPPNDVIRRSRRDKNLDAEFSQEYLDAQEKLVQGNDHRCMQGFDCWFYRRRLDGLDPESMVKSPNDKCPSSSEEIDDGLPHFHRKLTPEEEDRFVNAATGGIWASSSNSATTTGGEEEEKQVKTENYNDKGSFTLDNMRLLYTFGETCACPTAVCYRRPENLERVFSGGSKGFGADLPGGLEVYGFRVPERNEGLGCLASTPTADDGDGAFIPTEEQIREILYSEDYGRKALGLDIPLARKGRNDDDAGDNSSNTSSKKKPSTAEFAGDLSTLCDMWKGLSSSSSDAAAHAAEADRRKNELDEMLAAEAASAATKPAADKGVSISQKFAARPRFGKTGFYSPNPEPSLEIRNGCDPAKAETLDELLEAYESGVSFFNNPMLENHNPVFEDPIDRNRNKDLPLGTIESVHTGWFRSDGKESPLFPNREGLKTNPMDPKLTRPAPTATESGADDAEKRRNQEEGVERRLPASHWHPDLRCLRYRTDWCEVLTFLEEQRLLISKTSESNRVRLFEGELLQKEMNRGWHDYLPTKVAF